MDLSIVVPAFNEAARIPETIAAAVSFLDTRAWVSEIIVVDDGSSDATATIVAAIANADPRVCCLRNDGNRGKGYSIRAGVARARGSVVGFVDADNKTEFGALDLVMERMRDRSVDGVIGDRTLAGSAIEKERRAFRQLGSDLFRRLLRRYAGLPDFPDTQCGFKFFRQRIAQDLFARQRVDGYMFDVEILMLAVRSGYGLARIPVVWRDDPDSRFSPVSGMLKNLGELRNIRRYLKKGA